MNQAAVERYAKEFDCLQLNSSDWLRAQRQSAIEALRLSGFPNTRQEDWKYTDIRPITKRNFVAFDNNKRIIDPHLVDCARYKDMESYELVFINGKFSTSLSNVDDLAAEIIIKPLADALSLNREIVEQYINRNAEVGKNGFVALNTAFSTDGAFVYVPDNNELERPVNLIFISDKQQTAFVSHIRNLIVLGKHSNASVVETYIGVDDAEYFTNTVTEVVTCTGAKLDHYKLQQESLRSYHIGSLNIHQKENSRFESHSISLGGSLVRNDIDCNMAESGSEITMNGLYIVNGRQHVDNHTCVNHSKPHTSSEEYYRGVLDGYARGVFNGKVIIHKQAQKTNAHQSNNNLLMSDTAEVDTKPELEIYADDVKCSHGVTIGQLNENMLFYLRSRAIEEKTARGLLTFAFADDVIKKIKLTPIRNRLESIVVSKLPDTDLIKDFLNDY